MTLSDWIIPAGFIVVLTILLSLLFYRYSRESSKWRDD